VAYSLSLRNLEEMMAERGIEVDHSSMHRWLIKLVPLFEKAFRRYKRPVGKSARMDETYVKVRGQWKFLYRAVDKEGYKGVALDGVKVYHPGLRRGITRGLRAMIRRRSAIEPAIGHMKADGKLHRNWLKGALGDAMHAVLCGAGHNMRMILHKLRLFYALILLALLSFETATSSAA
jgi:IS5 family transposase